MKNTTGYVKALVAAGVGAGLWAWRRARRPSRPRRFLLAAQRVFEHPERVASGEPSVRTKVLAAAVAAIASIAARRLATRALSRA